MKLILRRIEHSVDGIFGVLKFEDKTFQTLELPWNNNTTGSSAIPAGEYEAMYTWSPSFRRRLYLICDVPNRVGIRIHSANTMDQLNGCIALGYKLGMINGKRAILQSRMAVDDFEKLLNFKPFSLVIIDEGVKNEVA